MNLLISSKCTLLLIPIVLKISFYFVGKNACHVSNSCFQNPAIFRLSAANEFKGVFFIQDLIYIHLPIFSESNNYNINEVIQSITSKRLSNLRGSSLYHTSSSIQTPIQPYKFLYKHPLQRAPHNKKREPTDEKEGGCHSRIRLLPHKCLRPPLFTHPSC